MDNITRFWDNLVGGLPNVVVALIVLVVALLLGWLTKFLITKLLKAIGVARGMEKAGVEKANGKKAINFVGNLAFLIVFALFLPGIFEKLGLNNIATPIMSMMDKFLAYLPQIIGAVIVILVGLFVAKLVKELLKPLLKKTKLDSFVEKAGLNIEKISIANILVNIIYVVIVVFFSVESIKILNLEVLTKIGEQIIAYLPYALSAAITILLAYLLGSWVETALVKNFNVSKATALISKIVIIVIGAFITMYQLGIAPEMVNAAFIIVLGAFGVAFAISFGMGGREFAAHTMKKFEQKLDENARARRVKK